MMQFPQYLVVVVGMLASATANALPIAGVSLEIFELAYLSQGYRGEQITNCDVSKAVLPTSDGPNYLSPPDAGFTLSRVVLGRGTQNYTCADSTANSIPVSQGAVADLYDASCIAAKRPELLHRLPGALVNLNKNLIESAVSIIGKMSRADILVGHHYFAPNNTVPVFDFRMKKPQPWILMGKRDQSVPAVTTASKGIATELNGAVDWLRIKAIASMSVDFKLAYRVQTAGGKPATTCQGQPESFEIQYASEYWIYS